MAVKMSGESVMGVFGPYGRQKGCSWHGFGVLMVGSGMGEMLHRPGHWCASQHPPTETSATKTSIGVCIIMSPLAPFPLSVAL